MKKLLIILLIPLIGFAQTKNGMIEKYMVQSESELSFAQGPQEQQVQITKWDTGGNPYYSYFGSGEYDSENNFYLKVKAPSDSDIVFNLINNRNNKIVRSVYIKRSEEYTIEWIKPGLYDYSYMSGLDWWSGLEINNGIKGGFVRNLSFHKNRYGQDQLEYEQGYTGGYVITLINVVGGNLDTREVGKSDFFD
tara:strand:+ start:186 stop:764 length:579 start_codon:yes stop_codon:yes gene_type:complete